MYYNIFSQDLTRKEKRNWQSTKIKVQTSFIYVYLYIYFYFFNYFILKDFVKEDFILYTKGFIYFFLYKTLKFRKKRIYKSDFDIISYLTLENSF